MSDRNARIGTSNTPIIIIQDTDVLNLLTPVIYWRPPPVAAIRSEKDVVCDTPTRLEEGVPAQTTSDQTFINMLAVAHYAVGALAQADRYGAAQAAARSISVLSEAPQRLILLNCYMEEIDW